MKAATRMLSAKRCLCSISIHAAREGGDKPKGAVPFAAYISIHAAREGGDGFYPHSAVIARISIHAAREGGDVTLWAVYARTTYFNPRRP